MSRDILFAIWFMLPAAIGNVTPILAAVTPGLRRFDQPIDGNRQWRGKPIFGSHKTWRGLLAGIVMAALTFWLQRNAYAQSELIRDFCGPVHYDTLPWILGPLLGFGALAGDAIKSFFKRHRGIPSGKSWFPFDQLDYIIGAVIISLPFVRLSIMEYVWIFVIWFGMHLLFSYLGWMVHLKDQPI
jgi:CDP-2,3-bis-(O-geranylgeranyl)-sn-glycerol synthase